MILLALNHACKVEVKKMVLGRRNQDLYEKWLAQVSCYWTSEVYRLYQKDIQKVMVSIFLVDKRKCTFGDKILMRSTTVSKTKKKYSRLSMIG
jgi:hypothetical protein